MALCPSIKIAYDGRPVVSNPEVYCMAVDDGRYGSITEQGTDYDCR